MQMNFVPKGQTTTGEYKVIKPFALSLDTAISSEFSSSGQPLGAPPLCRIKMKVSTYLAGLKFFSKIKTEKKNIDCGRQKEKSY